MHVFTFLTKLFKEQYQHLHLMTSCQRDVIHCNSLWLYAEHCEIIRTLLSLITLSFFVFCLKKSAGIGWKLFIQCTQKLVCVFLCFVSPPLSLTTKHTLWSCACKWITAAQCWEGYFKEQKFWLPLGEPLSSDTCTSQIVSLLILMLRRYVRVSDPLNNTQI